MKPYKNTHAAQTIITRPARPASIEADVVVPLLQTLVTAALAGLCAVLILATLRVPRAALWALGIALVSALALFAWLLRINRPLLEETELVINRDLNRDGHVGPQPHPIETISRTPNGRHIKFQTIPFRSRRDAIQLATAVVGRGVTFSRRALVGEGAFPDDPDYYSEIYQAMINVEYLRQAGRGAELTPAGRDFLLQVLSQHPR